MKETRRITRKKPLEGTRFAEELDALLQDYASASGAASLRQWCRRVALWTAELCTDEQHGCTFVNLINAKPRKLSGGGSRAHYDKLVALLVQGYQKIKDLPDRPLDGVRLEEPLPRRGFIYMTQLETAREMPRMAHAFADYATNEIRAKLHDPLCIMTSRFYLHEGDPFLFSVGDCLDSAASCLVYNMLVAGVGPEESLDFYSMQPADSPSEWTRAWYDYLGTFARPRTRLSTWLGINALVYGPSDEQVFGCLPDEMQEELKARVTALKFGELSRFQQRVFDALAEIKAKYSTPTVERDISPIQQPYRFVRDGAVWLVRYCGEGTYVDHCKGMVYIDQLLKNPNKPFSAFQLQQAIGDAPMWESPDLLEDHSTTDDKTDGRKHGTSGNWVNDWSALKAYKERLADIEPGLEQAGRNNDTAEQTRLQHEKECLLKEMANLKRQFTDNQQRSTNTISHAIHRAEGHIEGRHGPLAQYLRSSINTGAQFSYTPKPEIPWQFD